MNPHIKTDMEVNKNEFYKNLFSIEYKDSITSWLTARISNIDDIRHRTQTYRSAVVVDIDSGSENISVRISNGHSLILSLMRKDGEVTVLKNYIMVEIYDELVVFVNSVIRKRKLNNLL
jgi:hypothetical protein